MADAPASPTPLPIRRIRRSLGAQAIFGGFVMAAFLGVILLMCWHSVPADNKDMLDTLIGFIGGAFTSVVAFYFGTTSSSHDKDQTIQALSATPTSGATP